jgi:phosphoribosylaminoimidazolecarboxamide formyltransferase/IMP cyclohydrolase
MRAIVSVSDKSGIELLGRGLAGLGIEIYSTGGTKRALEGAGVPVQSVSALTGFPEILGGRVKTLHPAVHGGILARRELAGDLAELAEHNLGTIDVVAVNLYPFEQSVARLGTSLSDALEQIDIGGPTMLRASAKNFRSVLVLCDPADYGAALEALGRPEGASEAFRRGLATKAFRHTAGYDALIAAYLGQEDEAWPEELAVGLRRVQELRYGENPQQRAAFYAVRQPGAGDRGLAAARQLQGKPLSYNNILDADAAWAAASDYQPIAVAVIKHTNPCGLAWIEGSGPAEEASLAAYELALAGDPEAAFGGIVAVNAPVGEGLARRLTERFYEIVLAPAFSEGALEILGARPNLRVLDLPFVPSRDLRWRSVAGGMLVQEADHLDASEVAGGKVVSQRPPSDEEWLALDFAWRAVRHVKSNAIVLARGEGGRHGRQAALVGMGAGQPSRVASVEIAAGKAGERAAGSALASDAFFPKADGIEAAARAGVQAIVQPGGSLGDDEGIAAADAAGMAMVFTGTRHFCH